MGSIMDYYESIKKSLGVSAKITDGYREKLLLINHHLKNIYGDRAKLGNRLNAYHSSPEYKYACHKANNIEEVKLLEVDDIERMLLEEKQYSAKVNELINVYETFKSPHQGPERTRLLNKLASILGIFPENDEKALFNWILNRNEIAQYEQCQLHKQIKDKCKIFEIVIETLSRLFVPGLILEYPHVGRVMTQQRGKYYYRGERAFYKSSKASFYRNSTTPIKIRDIVYFLRLFECWNFLDQLNAVKGWELSHINYFALSQHYGLKTKMLDITSDLKTALFFACCKYGDDRKWHPLKKSEIEQINSNSAIRDTRFGIIYRTPTEITDIKWAMAGKKEGNYIVTPVGYQPFMRCSHQHSYMMLTNNYEYDMLQDPLFEKFKIPLNENFCKEIYNQMDQGNKIYPNDDIPDITKEIEKINALKIFSESVFQSFFHKINVTKHGIDMTRKLLSEHGFRIMENLELIDKEKLTQINSQYTAEYAMRKVELSPSVSPLIII